MCIYLSDTSEYNKRRSFKRYEFVSSSDRLQLVPCTRKVISKEQFENIEEPRLINYLTRRFYLERLKNVAARRSRCVISLSRETPGVFPMDGGIANFFRSALSVIRATDPLEPIDRYRVAQNLHRYPADTGEKSSTFVVLSAARSTRIAARLLREVRSRAGGDAGYAPSSPTPPAARQRLLAPSGASSV